MADRQKATRPRSQNVRNQQTDRRTDREVRTLSILGSAFAASITGSATVVSTPCALAFNVDNDGISVDTLSPSALLSLSPSLSLSLPPSVSTTDHGVQYQEPAAP